VSDDILTERRGRVLWITFNRPQARNAMKLTMYERLVELCTEINADDELRAVVLSGAAIRRSLRAPTSPSFEVFKHPTTRSTTSIRSAVSSRCSNASGFRSSRPSAALARAAACRSRPLAICASRPPARASAFRSRARSATVSQSPTTHAGRHRRPTVVKEMVYLAKLIDAQRALAAGFLNEVLPMRMACSSEPLKSPRRSRETRHSRFAHERSAAAGLRPTGAWRTTAT